jgi:hypothetical protein
VLEREREREIERERERERERNESNKSLLVNLIFFGRKASLKGESRKNIKELF